MKSMMIWLVRQYADEIVARLLDAARRKAEKTGGTSDDLVVDALTLNRQALAALLKQL